MLHLSEDGLSLQCVCGERVVQKVEGAGACGLAVTGFQWRDQGSERSEGGQGQWNALRIISRSYRRLVSPAHTLNVLELITPGSQIAAPACWAPKEADSGSGS